MGEVRLSTPGFRPPAFRQGAESRVARQGHKPTADYRFCGLSSRIVVYGTTERLQNLSLQTAPYSRTGAGAWARPHALPSRLQRYPARTPRGVTEMRRQRHLLPAKG